MTSIEWRKREDLQSAAAQVLENPHLKSMLDIMRNESPIQSPMPRLGSTDSDKAMAYGTEVGYQLALKRLQMFAVPFTEPQPIVSTFKPPQDEKPE